MQCADTPGNAVQESGPIGHLRTAQIGNGNMSNGNEEKWLIPMIFGVSSVAGMARMLWEDKPIPLRKSIGAVLLSGFSGAIVCMLLWEPLIDRPMLMSGVSILAGIGGASTIDLLTVGLRTLITKRLGKLTDDDSK